MDTHAPASRRARIVLVTVGVVLAVLVIGWWLFPWNMLREPLERRVSEATGREFTIDGDLQVRFGFPPIVVGHGVRLGNADWSQPPYMAEAERVEARFSPIAALRGQWPLKSVTLHSARLLFEWDADGRSNWAGVVADDDAAQPRDDGVELRRVVAHDSEVLLSDPTRQFRLFAVVQSVDPHARGAVPMRIAGDGRLRGQAFTIEGELDSPTVLGMAGRGYSLALQLASGSARGRVAGTLDGAHPLRRFGVNVELAGDDAAELGPFLAREFDSTPPYQLTARLERDRTQWAVRGIDGALGDSTVGGELLLDDDGPRPRLHGQLQLRLDAAELMAEGTRERLFPDFELGLDALQDVDADVELSLQSNGEGIFEGAGTRLRLEAGQGTLEPFTVQMAGGEIDGRIDLDLQATPIAYRVDASVRRVQLPKLFPDTEVGRGQRGHIVGRIELAGNGGSLADMIGSADGQIRLLMGSTRLPGPMHDPDDDGIDWASILGYDSAADEWMHVRCAYVELDVDDGVADASTLLIDLERSLLVGEGALHLDDERFDLVLQPRPKEAGFPGAATPLEISGPLLAPDTGLQTGGLVARGALAAALAVITPPAALLTLIETGPGEDLDCARIAAPAAS